MKREDQIQMCTDLMHAIARQTRIHMQLQEALAKVEELKRAADAASEEVVTLVELAETLVGEEYSGEEYETIQRSKNTLRNTRYYPRV